MFIKAKYVDLNGYLDIDTGELIFENRVFGGIKDVITDYSMLISLKIERDIVNNFLNDPSLGF